MGRATTTGTLICPLQGSLAHRRGHERGRALVKRGSCCDDPLVMRFLIALILLCVAAFSGFGFLATYEPMDDGSHLTWRVGYGVAIVASLFGVVRALRKGSRSD